MVKPIGCGFVFLSVQKEKEAGMKVKYIGSHDTLAFDKDKIYEVMSIERDWYRIMTELDEDYLFTPELFEIVEE